MRRKEGLFLVVGLMVITVLLVSSTLYSGAAEAKKNKKYSMIIWFGIETYPMGAKVKFYATNEELDKPLASKTIDVTKFLNNWQKTQDDPCCTLVIKFKKDGSHKGDRMGAIASGDIGGGGIADERFSTSLKTYHTSLGDLN